MVDENRNYKLSTSRTVLYAFQSAVLSILFQCDFEVELLPFDPKSDELSVSKCYKFAESPNISRYNVIIVQSAHMNRQ